MISLFFEIGGVMYWGGLVIKKAAKHYGLTAFRFVKSEYFYLLPLL